MNRRKSPPPGLCPGCQYDPQLSGEIKGKLDMIHEGVKGHAARLDGLDARLRSVENKGAVAGAVAGLLMAVGVNLAGWWLKGKN